MQKPGWDFNGHPGNNNALSGELFYRKSRMTRSENYYPTLLPPKIGQNINAVKGSPISTVQLAHSSEQAKNHSVKTF